MLTLPSQLLLRNPQYLQGDVLLINHENDHCAIELLPICQSVTTLALDYNHHLTLQGSQWPQLRSHFGHKLPEDHQGFDRVVIYYPKAKPLLDYLLELAASYLRPQGMLLVVGENNGGIRSFPKHECQWFANVRKLDSARHCLLYSAEGVGKPLSIDENRYISSYPLLTPHGKLTICNMVGVFSEKQLDMGTALLLNNIPPLAGRVLDFGCGAGVIGAALLQAQPQLQLECVDINAMALLSCQKTMAANGISARIYASDGLAQTSAPYDAIISNPPFHDGLTSTTDIATQFVAASHQQLVRGGLWQIVANRHLPYSDVIARHFGEVNVVAENSKYKIYRNRG